MSVVRCPSSVVNGLGVQQGAWNTGLRLKLYAPCYAANGVSHNGLLTTDHGRRDSLAREKAWSAVTDLFKAGRLDRGAVGSSLLSRLVENCDRSLKGVAP